MYRQHMQAQCVVSHVPICLHCRSCFYCGARYVACERELLDLSLCTYMVKRVALSQLQTSFPYFLRFSLPLQQKLVL